MLSGNYWIPCRLFDDSLVCSHTDIHMISTSQECSNSAHFLLYGNYLFVWLDRGPSLQIIVMTLMSFSNSSQKEILRNLFWLPFFALEEKCVAKRMWPTLFFLLLFGRAGKSHTQIDWNTWVQSPSFEEVVVTYFIHQWLWFFKPPFQQR